MGTTKQKISINSANKTELNTDNGIAVAECHISQMISREEKEANALHIMKCWNSHDDLLDACKGLMKEADDGSARFDDPAPDSIFIKAAKAIAEAEK